MKGTILKYMKTRTKKHRHTNTHTMPQILLTRPHCSVVTNNNNRKKILQILLRQQKKIAHTLSIVDGYHTNESRYAWKTVKSLEKTITEINMSLHEDILTTLNHNQHQTDEIF